MPFNTDGAHYVSALSTQGRAALTQLGYPASVTQTEQITGPLGQVVIPGFSPLGVDVYHFPQSRANNTIQIAETLRYLRGDHAFTFGSDLRRTQVNSVLDRNFAPLVQFNSLNNPGSSLPQQALTGATLAAAGAPTGLFQTLAVVPDSTIGLRYTQMSFFAQHEWSARPNLNFTLGIRYEFNALPATVGRKVERALDASELRRLTEEAAQSCDSDRCNDLIGALAAAFPADFKESFNSDRHDVDFRLGFALDPGVPGRAVVRGGIGFYSGQFPGIVLSQSRNALQTPVAQLATLAPRHNLSSQTILFNPANPLLRNLSPETALIVPGSLNRIVGTNPVSLLVNQLARAGMFSNAPDVVGLDLVLPQKNLSTPSALQYGIIVERRVFDDYYISASYVGTRGRKLLRVTTPDMGINNSFIALGNAQPQNRTTATGAGGQFPFYRARTSRRKERYLGGVHHRAHLLDSAASST